MIINYRIALLFPFLFTIYINLDTFEGGFTSWDVISLLLLSAYLMVYAIKRNEYGWLRYDEELEDMLNQSVLFVRRKNIFGVPTITSVKSLPWIITKNKMKKLMEKSS